MRAMDMDAPVIGVTLGGFEMELRFDNEMIRRTEIAYAMMTGVQMGYLGILSQAERKIFGALCAMVYGAAVSAQRHNGVGGDQLLTVARLDRRIGYDELTQSGEAIVEAAMRALDTGRRDAKKHGDAAGGSAVEPDDALGAERRD